jgi:hypothetical protein
LQYNPFAQRCSEMQRLVQATQEERDVCVQLLFWHKTFNLNAEIENLSLTQREFSLIMKEIDELESKKIKEVAIKNELLPKAKIGINPSRWFSSQRFQYANLLKESKFRLAEINTQIADGESRSLAISNINIKRQTMLNKYRTLDTLEQQAKLNGLELRLKHLRAELTETMQSRQRVDSLIQPHISEKCILQQRLEKLQNDLKLADAFDQRLTKANNTYEKAIVHKDCGAFFSGERNPSRVKHNKQREIESVIRNLSKIDARLQKIVLIATRKISRLVIDGNNLCYEGGIFIGIKALTALTYEIAENYEVIVVFDASIRTLLGINDQQIAFGFPLKVRVHVVANKQTADQTILEMASNADAYVISNDRFRDFTDKSAVNSQRLIRHEILARNLMIHDLNIAITYN